MVIGMVKASLRLLGSGHTHRLLVKNFALKMLLVTVVVKLELEDQCITQARLESLK
jgi:hypothetical protein